MKKLKKMPKWKRCVEIYIFLRTNSGYFSVSEIKDWLKTEKRCLVSTKNAQRDLKDLFDACMIKKAILKPNINTFFY